MMRRLVFLMAVPFCLACSPLPSPTQPDLAQPDAPTPPPPDLSTQDSIAPPLHLLRIETQAEAAAPCAALLGHGVVTVPALNLVCGARCESELPRGSGPVVLRAEPDPRSRFVGWEGACASAGTSSPCTIAVQGLTQVKARFAPRSFFAVTMTDTKGGGRTEVFKGDSKLDEFAAPTRDKAEVRCFEALDDEVFSLRVTVPSGSFFFGNAACVAPRRCDSLVVGSTVVAVVLR